MDGLVVTIFYGSIVFCITASIIKLITYARYPVHLRWEIHKSGSAYEYASWWENKGAVQKGKTANIAKATFSLKEYYKNNRLFWLPLFPFHLGVYLLILWHAWLFIYPLIFTREWPVGYSLVWGHTATGLMFAGALGVLILRIFNRPLRASYPRRHYIKWVIIMLAAGTGFIAVEWYFNGVMADVLGYVRGQLQFDMAEKMNPPLLTSLHVLAVAAVLIYLPFSHAVRLFFRYFHELRWNYLPVLTNKRVGRNTKDVLEYPVTWAAKHVPAGMVWKDIG